MDGEVPWRRRLFSEVGNVVGAALFGIGVRDVTNGFRAMPDRPLPDMPLHERGFPVIVEELDCALQSGIVAGRVPDRADDESRTSARPSSSRPYQSVILTSLRILCVPGRGGSGRRLGRGGR